MKSILFFLLFSMAFQITFAKGSEGDIFQKRELQYEQFKDKFDEREMLDKQLFGKRVRDIAHKLRCPLCQGLSVKESNSSISIMMKTRIHELLEEGKTEDEILDHFVKRYGEWILTAPRKTGTNLILWVLPGALISVAIVSILVVSKRRSSGLTPELPPLTSDEKQQIENDLKQFE